MFHRQSQNHGTAVQEKSANVQVNTFRGQHAGLWKKDKSLIIESMAPVPSKYHVLVVHHHPGTLHMMAAMFRKFGYHVSTARDSAKALISFRQKGYDVLFTDLDMPVLDGYNLACLIKKYSPQAKVVIMTCRCQAELVGLMRDGTVDGWLFKPFKTSAFKTTLTGIGLGAQPKNRHKRK